MNAYQTQPRISTLCHPLVIAQRPTDRSIVTQVEV